MLRLIPAVALLCLLLPASFSLAQVQTIDLQDDPGWLPYRFRLVFKAGTQSVWEQSWGTCRIYDDFNGDGIDDHIRVNEFGLGRVETKALDEREIWQTNFPAAYTDDDPSGTVDGVWDIDGDGRLEVLSTASSPDGYLWMVRAIDLETGEIHSEYHFQGGEDVRGDGGWDGKYRSFGFVDVPTGEGMKRGLVVAFMAGYDKLPRGVQVREVETDILLWEYLAGPKIMSHNIQVVDIDGDGRNEVVFLGGGVNNLGGELVNGTTDDHARVFMLNEDGTLAWTHRLGDAPSGGIVKTFDVEGDGTLEVMVTGFIPHLDSIGIGVYRADGSFMMGEPLGGLPRSVFAFIDHNSSPVVVAAVGNEIHKYALGSEDLTLEAQTTFGSMVSLAGVFDLIPEDGLEIVANSMSGGKWILDEDLVPLGYHLDEKVVMRFDNTFVTMRPDGNRRLISMGTKVNPQAHYDIVRNARPVPWAAILSVSGVGGGALVAWRRRRKPKSKGTVRELRLQLLGRLKLSGHGAIGALSSVRRIIWHLETVRQGFEPDQRVMNLFQDLSEDTLRVGLPGLQAAVELAELAQMDGDTVKAAKKATDRLEVLLEGLAGAGFELDSMMAVREELQATATEADQRFREIRHLVEEAFQANPMEVFERSLAAHAAEMDDLGVEVLIELAGVPAVQMDVEELAFIVDNLVENAVRAMNGSPEKNLGVSWQEAGEHVVLLVADTGCGIPPDELELVMKPGHSKRQGGGLGLPRSQEILGKYGGGITVKESSPGRGTTMALLAPSVPSRTETH